MMETILSRSIRAICLGGMTLGMHAAYAQEASQPMQRIEVTGSRIRQVDLETAQPVQVMTQQQIQATGLVTVGDILNQLSSAGSPDFSKGGALTSNRENGGQFINLRNLGSQRLLVLVDGKRWTQTVDGYTDMSTVPSAMIERIEVLKDGASSIYGSDAIAGVVNIILKKKLEGGQLSVYVGRNEEGDGKNKDFSLSFGAGSDKANIMFGLSHTEQGVVWARDRDITRFPRTPKYPTEGLGIGPWANIGNVNGGAFSEFDKVLNHTGDQNGGGVGADSRNPANYHDWDGRAADNFNSASQMMFQMPNRLDTIFTKGTVELPYGMQFGTTAMFSQRKSSAQVAGYPLNSESQPAFPVYVDKDSYYNPYGNSVAGAGLGQDLFFYRRTVEVPRVTENTNRTLHVDATLSGDFEMRSMPWNWSVGYNHSATSGSTLGTGNVNLLNLKRALGPSFMNSSGVVQCGTPGAPISLTECTPFNIIGGPSASTPAALAYVMSTGQATYGSTINSATADIAGEIFTLPAGAVGIAAGIEHREVRGYDIPGQFEQSGYSTDLAGNATRGRYTVREAYAELNVPLLKGMSMAELLSVNLATRHSDYSNFGVTNNSKASFMWKPVKDVLVRGTWAEGFRAPAVGDAFGGGQQSFDEYVDPCDAEYGQRSAPGVDAACTAAGAGPGFRQMAQTGPITSSAGDQTKYPFIGGLGNANLSPETAVTKTAGFVYNPSFLPGFSAALDWFNIKVMNQITGLEATEVAEYCYVRGLPTFCGALKRDPVSGEIISLSRGNVNKGALETEGLDLALSYRMKRNAYGQFGIRSETSYVDVLREQAETGSEWKNYEGEYFYNRVKSNLSLDWNLGNWNATWTSRYYSGVKDRCYKNNTTECNGIGGVTSWGKNYNKLGSMTYTDLSVGYKTSWKGQVLVGVNNVFAKEPRMTVEGASSSSLVDADYPIDRFFYVRYNQSF